MTHKIFQCRSGETGPATPVTVRYTRYSSNDTLAVQLIKAEKPWSVHATITVNLDGNPFGMDSRQDGRFAYVDTNNCPWAERFLEENKIARRTGIFAPSGYCVYPLYEINLDAIYEYEESEI